MKDHRRVDIRKLKRTKNKKVTCPGTKNKHIRVTSSNTDYTRRTKKLKNSALIKYPFFYYCN